MSGSFVSFYQEGTSPVNVDEGPFATLPSRRAILESLQEVPEVDAVIVGGGSAGALIARDAALRGLRVALIERGFFGDRAAPWRGSFLQAARERLSALLLSGWELRGVSRRVLGDLTEFTPIDTGLEPNTARSLVLRVVRRLWGRKGAARGGQGIPDLNERALTRELVLAARQEGALALASAEVAFVERVSESESFRVGVRDRISGELVEITARAVVVNPRNGAPVVTRLGTPLTPTLAQESPVVLSVCAVTPISVRTGALLLSVELSDGSLAVIKKISDGLVEVSLWFSKQVPKGENVTDLIGQACQEAGWKISKEVSRTRTGYRFSPDGVVSERKGVISYSERFPWEIEGISRRVLKVLLGRVGETSKQPRVARQLPGAERACEISAFRAFARGQGVHEGIIEMVVKRWRGRVRYLNRFPDGMCEVCPGILKGEVDLALASDQPVTLDDLFIGSLDVRHISEWRACLPTIARLAGERSGISVTKDDIERVASQLSCLDPE